MLVCSFDDGEYFEDDFYFTNQPIEREIYPNSGFELKENPSAAALRTSPTHLCLTSASPVILYTYVSNFLYCLQNDSHSHA